MSLVSEIIEVKVAKRLEAKKGDLSGKVVLDITGPEGGQWTLNCDEATIAKGAVTLPDVKIIMTDQNFIALLNGELNAATAMFTGKLKIEGDMALATKLAMAIR